MLHKIGLVRTLIDRVFKINNTWLGFHDDIKKLVLILRINVFAIHLIDTCINRLSCKAVIRDGSTYTRPPIPVDMQDNTFTNYYSWAIS